MKAIIRFILIVLAVFVLIFILVFVFAAAQNEKRQEMGQPSARPQPGAELKALWVPYLSLELPEKSRSEQGFRDHFDNIVKMAVDSGFNCVVVHVRSHSDAMYDSKYYPWSHLLTGTQGKDPGYDPLTYMTEASHKAGLSFHAWINPLRVVSGKTPEALCDENPYVKWTQDTSKDNDRWTVKLSEGIYFNPAYGEVRAHIIDGIREIVEKYAVDGIHFDDYFYPVGAKGDNLFDRQEYDAYLKKEKGDAPLSLLQWRTANINMLVSGVYAAIKAIDSSVQFGISPQANFDNCKSMGADVRTWGSREGYVDYLCPQVYFSFEHQSRPFASVCTEWREAVSSEKVRRYIGLALYKAALEETNDPGWAASDDVIRRQIIYGRESLHWDGFMVYSSTQLNQGKAKRESQNMISVLRNSGAAE